MTTSDSKDRFNVRIFTSRKDADLESEMENVHSEWAGIVRMVPKAVSFVVKVHGLRSPAAIILKEEMLSKGGDAAIHRDCITNRVERSDVLLMGMEKAYRMVIPSLREQPFSLRRLADEIERAIDRFKSQTPMTPSDDHLPKGLRAFYAAIRERTAVMGILNVTPDSFTDGGLYPDVQSAVEHALRMVNDGADAIDVGGESSRPGSESITADEELSRVIPVVTELAQRTDAPISIDTYKPAVAAAALDAGASIINDISGLADEKMRSLAAERKTPCVIMHMKGTPRTMQQNPVYEDLISDVISFLRERIGAAVDAGLPEQFLIIDPGIGFGKTAEHNQEIIRNLADFRSLGLPILIGTSRKAFIGKALGDLPPSDRIEGTAATVALSIANGANIIRVHDVKEMTRVARMTDEIVRSP